MRYLTCGVGPGANERSDDSERRSQSVAVVEINRNRYLNYTSPLIPRQLLFGNPVRSAPRISPDGEQIIYLAPQNGVLNVWLRSTAGGNDHPITNDRGRGVQACFWARNNRDILFLMDRDGDENWRLYTVDKAGGDPQLLTPGEGVQAKVLKIDYARPDEALVELNDRDRRLHDVYLLHIPTGRMTLAALNDIGATGWVADHDLVVRAATVPLPDGGMKMLYREDPDTPWREILRWGSDDLMTTAPLQFTPDNRSIWMRSSLASNSAELRRLDPATGIQESIATDPVYDLSNYLLHPTSRKLQAVAFERERTEWRALDAPITPHLEAVSRLAPGDYQLIGRTTDDHIWVVQFVTDTSSIQYYLYRTDRMTGELLFTSRPELDGLPLAPMQPVSYPARDGLTIHGYLTLPVGALPQDLPAIIHIHGGPWSRVTWGYHAEAQWLANRGYAVLQINFRGSTGYGKEFVNAGDREWGGAMQDDISDGVRFLVERGLADPKRVAIYGGSYGGYAVLAGLTGTPDLYACGVELVGPSNLISFQNSIPPYWEAYRPVLYRRIGNPETEMDLLRARSPLFHIQSIQAPLLIAQGANDPRVAKAESHQIVAALKEAGLEVEYLEFADEGHGFVRPENRLTFYAAAERFLAKHLGGRCEE